MLRAQYIPEPNGKKRAWKVNNVSGKENMYIIKNQLSESNENENEILG
jgi:hypothetical protein